MVNLKSKPFYLSDEDINWVNKTLKTMSIEEKIGQLFSPIGFDKSPGYLDNCLLRYHIGGVMYRAAPAEESQDCNRYLQQHSKIPLLIGGNLEAGGSGAATNGTTVGSQMQIAATNNPMNAYKLGKVCAREGKALGINWPFAPVVDIDMNWRNPITNNRTYGSTPETVLEYSLKYKQAMDEEKMACVIKHFPGDGWDEVDQHLLTSVNGLSCNDWDNSFGKIYQTMIDEGILSIMAGHIALPSYQKSINLEFPDRIVPATLSSELLQGLLRDKLKFNGLIVTDATPMAGFTTAMSREDAVPACIAAGCDMFLFNVELDEDYHFMMSGYEKGILTDERLDEAVTRILGLKASIGLHNKPAGKIVPEQEALDIVGCDEHLNWSIECADNAVTLVKDRDNILPIESTKHHRVLLQILGDFPSNERVIGKFENLLQSKGFEVARYIPETFEVIMQGTPVAKFIEKYDLVIYIGNIENASNKTTNRINWHTMFGKGNNLPWFVKDVPTIFISLANPYHLIDVPMIGTYINCYSNHDLMLESVFRKITGESAFVGISPVDPFCGKFYLEY